MSNNEYREAQQQAREHGLKARQERRLENATYTAAEVKVLTETASKVAYALGRKDAGEEIAAALEEFAANDIRGRSDMDIDRAAAIARGIGAMQCLHGKPGCDCWASTDAASARTDPSGHSDLPPEPRDASNRLPGGEG